MDIHRYAERVKDEFYEWGSLNAYPRIPLPYIEILEHAQGMTTPSTMHLLNLAVQCMSPEEIYLEVGTWRGTTFLGALTGNRAFGIAIDDDTMDNHDGDERSSQDVWCENIAHFGMTERARYVDGHVPDVWKGFDPASPIGVYLFDGDKSTEEAAYEGLAGVLPFLSDQALIFVDDANELPIRRATWNLSHLYPHNAAKILDLPTPGNCWPCFWNGIIAIAWQR